MGKEREVVMVAVVDVCRSTSAAVKSCWGRFGLAALWRRLRLVCLPRRHYRTYVLGAGGLNYDPLSYAQNFDDGSLGECEPDFTARFAPARRAGAPVPLAPSVTC